MRRKKMNALINERWMQQNKGAKMICPDQQMMDAQLKRDMRSRKPRTCAKIINVVQNAQQKNAHLRNGNLNGPECAPEEGAHAQS